MVLVSCKTIPTIVSATGTEQYVWAGNELLTSSGLGYFVSDYLGTPHRLVGGRGETADSLAVDAFGVQLSGRSPQLHPFGFTGYQLEDGGAYFAQARFYAPSIGRFQARDQHWNVDNMVYGDDETNLYMPLYPQMIPDNHVIRQNSNLYNYCLDNPLLFFDLMGQIADIAITIGIGAIVGAVSGAIKGVVRGVTAGESVGTIVARGAVGAVSGAVGGAVAGAVLYVVPNKRAAVTVASTAAGAISGALYGAGNAIIDGVNSGKSAKEIASSAAKASGKSALFGAGFGAVIGLRGMRMGGIISRSILKNSIIKGAKVSWGLNFGIGIYQGRYPGGIPDLLQDLKDKYNRWKDSSGGNTLCPS